MANPAPQGVSAGHNHTCWIQESPNSQAQLYCQGSNEFGQVGLPTYGSAIRPKNRISIPGAEAPTTVSAGLQATFFTTESGKLYGFGRNLYGVLATSSSNMDESTTPIRVGGSLLQEFVIKVKVSYSGQACALTATRKLFCWGDAIYGAVGDGNAATIDSSDREVATPVLIASDVVDFDLGVFHGCLLKNSSSQLDQQKAFCWGDNSDGELALGSPSQPVPTPTLSPLFTKEAPLRVALGADHSCFLTTKGKVFCVGKNNLSQLGVQSTESPIYQLTQAAALPIAGSDSLLTSGVNSNCLINKSQTSVISISCWGQSIHGQLGRVTSLNSLLPGPVPLSNSGFNVQEIRSASQGGYHLCLQTQSKTFCIGDNFQGAIRPLTQSGLTPTRVSLPSISTQSQFFFKDAIRSYGGLTCLLINPQNLTCFGNLFGIVNSSSQMGEGPNHVAQIPLPENSSARVFAISLQAICLITQSNKVFCRGTGQIPEDNPTWHQIVFPSSSFTPQILSAGESHFCALSKIESKIFCWGAGPLGQLGNGSLEPNISTAPVEVSLSVPNLQWLSSGDHHTCTGNGYATWCWGRGAERQISGTQILASLTPRLLEFSERISILSGELGGSTSCFLLSNYKIRCMGDHRFAQTGLITAFDGLAPPIAIMMPFKSFSVGTRNGCSLSGPSRIACWGYAQENVLGISAQSLVTSPRLLSQNIANVVALLSEDGASFAINSIGQVFAWGQNKDRRLGIETRYFNFVELN